MAVSYKPLWRLLIEKDMKKRDLKTEANITGNIVARMGKNGYIDMKSIEKICLALDCSPNDIFEIKKNK
ncbi:DNA-binding Xre family transcriptional regulator [Alkalihalobacillus xiaoxiensis]|uniref:DNA-binding Xre family transcriptional regulator n=1 Tax=Shouchella xiaoxiensis TaxID=766895 RepID=A0ABS2SVL6_9BACI|nr:helix-turn-helix domain-containing protein [Shouchella xiaoxiensis]MBM7839575.1 DNA-binding Xre family transcriptional regulator [Shouchella xiaoxiensis]